MIQIKEAVVRQVLEALEDASGELCAYSLDLSGEDYNSPALNDAITALRRALSDSVDQPAQQEPVAWMNPDDLCADTAFRWCEIDDFTEPVYRRPQAREWVGLTDEQIEQCMKQAYATVQGRNLEHAFARAIEAKLRELNEQGEKNA